MKKHKNKTKQNKTKIKQKITNAYLISHVGHIPYYCNVQIKCENPVKSAATLRATITHLDAGNFVR